MAVAPWHLLRAVVASLPALVLPVLLGLSSAFCAVLLTGATLPLGGARPVAGAQLAAAVGLLVGLLVAWWGPGGASVRRGARGLARGVVRGSAGTNAFVAVCLTCAVGSAYLSYVRGHPDFMPLHQLPLGITAP